MIFIIITLLHYIHCHFFYYGIFLSFVHVLDVVALHAHNNNHIINFSYLISKQPNIGHYKRLSESTVATLYYFRDDDGNFDF